jgi:hypothetical protein
MGFFRILSLRQALDQNDSKGQKQIPPLRCGMTNKKTRATATALHSVAG